MEQLQIASAPLVLQMGNRFVDIPPPLRPIFNDFIEKQ